jgi:PAS domain S-box-containing protein
MNTESALQRFLDTAPTGLVRNTSDLRYAAANAAYAQLVGRPLDQIVGRTLEEVIGTGGFTQILPHVRRVLQGERVEFEAQVAFTATGQRWIHVIYTPDYDDNRTITGWVGSITDITDRKQIEQALQERERVQRLLVQAGDIGARASSSTALIGAIAELVATELNVSRCGFALVDEETGTIIVVNDFHRALPSVAGAYRLTEYAGHLADDSRRGRTVALDDIAADPRTAARYADAFAPIQVRAHLTVPLLRNGRWVASFWASHHEPRHWTPREIEVLTLLGDRIWSVVERMRAEEALRRSQEHLRFVTDYAPVLLGSLRSRRVLHLRQRAIRAAVPVAARRRGRSTNPRRGGYSGLREHPGLRRGRIAW